MPEFCQARTVLTMASVPSEPLPPPLQQGTGAVPADALRARLAKLEGRSATIYPQARACRTRYILPGLRAATRICLNPAIQTAPTHTGDTPKPCGVPDTR